MEHYFFLLNFVILNTNAPLIVHSFLFSFKRTANSVIYNFA